MKKTLITALAGTALAVGLAPAASATPADDIGYIDEIDSRGLTYPSEGWMIQIGHSVCYDLDVNGYGPSSEAAHLLVLNNTRTDGTITPYDAGWIVGSAIAWYCPWDK